MTTPPSPSGKNEEINMTDLTHQQIEAAAKVLAEGMDYPWEPMPEQGRKSMRALAVKVVEAALSTTAGEAAERVRAFLAEWQKRRGLHPEIIHSLGLAFGDLVLNVSDLHALLNAGVPEQSASTEGAPIDMVLYCPACGKQHIDSREPAEFEAFEPEGVTQVTEGWDNPPHRSHLCHTCGHIWRPADVPTNGVAAVKTKGKADSPLATPPAPTPAATGEVFAATMRNLFGNEFPQHPNGAGEYPGWDDHWKIFQAGAALAQPAPVPKWIDDPHDIEEGQMLNPAWLKLHGLTAAEAAGKPAPVQQEAVAANPVAAVRRRAEELIEKAGMHWDEAHELALDEAGVTREEVLAIVDDAAPRPVGNVAMLDLEERLSFARYCFIYPPEALQPTKTEGGAA